MALTVVLGKACTRCGGDSKKLRAGSLHGEENHNLYSIPNITNVIKSQRCAGQDRQHEWETRKALLSDCGDLVEEKCY
jgi:hypothetical protein